MPVQLYFIDILKIIFGIIGFLGIVFITFSLLIMLFEAYSKWKYGIECTREDDDSEFVQRRLDEGYEWTAEQELLRIIDWQRRHGIILSERQKRNTRERNKRMLAGRECTLLISKMNHGKIGWLYIDKICTDPLCPVHGLVIQ